MIGSVRSTYRGYQLIIDPHDILAIAPNGDTHCQPSMSTIRRWVNHHRMLSGREPDAPLASTRIPIDLTVPSRPPSIL